MTTSSSFLGAGSSAGASTGASPTTAWSQLSSYSVPLKVLPSISTVTDPFTAGFSTSFSTVSTSFGNPFSPALLMIAGKSLKKISNAREQILIFVALHCHACWYCFALDFFE